MHSNELKKLSERVEALEMIIGLRLKEAYDNGTLPSWLSVHEVEEMEEEDVCINGTTHSYSPSVTNGEGVNMCIHCGNLDSRTKIQS